MNTIRGSWATCYFELIRSLTLQRLMVFAVLSLFPPMMVFLLAWAPRVWGGDADIVFVEFLTLFLVATSSILSLLLWGSTNVYAELEGKSWIYLSSRPSGRVATVLGKFLAAALMSWAVSLVCCTLCVGVTSAFGLFEDPLRFWLVLNSVFLLMCLAYSAIFSLIGVVFYRRSMVFCAAYLLVVETSLPFVPALISRFTVRYHLQELLLHWMGWIFPGAEHEFRRLFPESPTWVHLLAIALMVIIPLFISATLVIRREYLTGDET